MSLPKKQRHEIREFILWNIREHPKDIVKTTQNKYGLSRTAILHYINQLSTENKIQYEGVGRQRHYSLKSEREYFHDYTIDERLAEDKAWRDDISPLFNKLPENVISIIHYGFTEIFNNAIDHSEGTLIHVAVNTWIDEIQIIIHDNGIGIFKKIANICKLDDPYQAILELAKGKLTTDPKSHTGEGIFFTSKMFDLFGIFSENLCFGSRKIQVLFETADIVKGTKVMMILSTKTKKTTSKVFSEFTSESGNYGFDKTIVPVELVRYGNENLISRSQAQRLLARLEKFKTVILDFKGINMIGRSFADEVFRVFVNSHPATKIYAANTNKSISRLIDEVQQRK